MICDYSYYALADVHHNIPSTSAFCWHFGNTTHRGFAVTTIGEAPLYRGQSLTWFQGHKQRKAVTYSAFILRKKKHEMNRNEIVSKRKPLLENIYIWSHTLKSWFLPRISLVFPQRHRGRDDVRHPAFRIRITHSRFSMVIPVVRRPANPLELPSLSASSARRRHCSASRLGLETKENQVVHGWKVFNNLDSLKTCPKVHVDGYGFPQMLVIHHMTRNATLKNRNSQGII